MIEYVLMDYEGEPVSIEEGEMLTWYPDEGEHWNSETCEFEPDEDDCDNSFWIALMRKALAIPNFHPIDLR